MTSLDVESDAYDVETAYKILISEAPYLPGDDGDGCEVKDIPWANIDLIRKGQDFIRRNYFSHALAGMGALLFGFSFKSLTTVLLRTGGFGLGDPVKSLHRHIETGSHTFKWYNTNIWDRSSPGFKDIQLVRRMHVNALRQSVKKPLILLGQDEVPDRAEKERIIEALKLDLAQCLDLSEVPHHLLTYHPQVFLSQFDMVMTLFGFVSLLFLFPEALGIRDTYGIDGFMHLWAVISRMLGIKDRFNIALHPDRRLHLKLFRNLAIPSLMQLDLTMLHMQQTFIDGMSSVFKTMTLRSSIYFGLIGNKEALPGFKGENLYALLTWKEKLYCKLKKFVILFLYHMDWVRKALNFSYGRISKGNREIVQYGDRAQQLKILRRRF